MLITTYFNFSLELDAVLSEEIVNLAFPPSNDAVEFVDFTDFCSCFEQILAEKSQLEEIISPRSAKVEENGVEDNDKGKINSFVSKKTVISLITNIYF